MGFLHTCEWCGESYTTRGRVQKSRFCSRGCQTRSMNRARALRFRVGDAPPAPVPGAAWLPVGRGEHVLLDITDADAWIGVTLSLGNHGYARFAVPGGHELLHRALMRVGPTDIVDHANGDRLDCRRENIRIVTRRGNYMNQRARGGTSKYKGVMRVGNRWRAQIKDVYKTVRLGMFDIEEDAARAYDDASRVMRGGLDRMNFPRDGERSALVAIDDIPIEVRERSR